MTDLLLAAAGQPWVYAVVVLGTIIDGFFPPFPSEAIVVGLASLAAGTSGPALWLLVPAAVAGAWIGDNVAFLIGRRMATARFAWLRGPFMERAFARAEQELALRAVSVILVARFIPVARVAVNLTAGATEFPLRRFMALSALSAVLWTGWSVGIGVLAGSWLSEYPVLGLLAAILLAGLLGLLADKLHGRLLARRAVASTEPAMEAACESATAGSR